MENQNSTPKIIKPSKEDDDASRLLKVLIEDFSRHIDPEKDPFVILLKGHLLLEYYLNQIVLLSTKGIKDIDKKGFFEKIKILESVDANLFIDGTFDSLKKLNEIRNRLSHSLNFKITESEIDTVGFYFGKEYVLEKYKNPNNKEFLLKWVLKCMARDVFYRIYAEVAKSKGLTPIAEG